MTTELVVTNKRIAIMHTHPRFLVAATSAIAICLSGCMAIPLALGAAGLVGALAPDKVPGANQDQSYTVASTDYKAVFNAAKVASATLSGATIASADQDTGLIQVKRGAAKNINIMVTRGNGNTLVKIDVVNFAGIWGLTDPKTDASDIVKSMQSQLGIAIAQ